MDRKLYAVCPICGKRATITKFFWDWDTDQDIANVKCECGSRSRIPYTESRILHVDLNNPYMKETHFDLLLPQGWNEEMWNKVSACIPHY